MKTGYLITSTSMQASFFYETLEQLKKGLNHLIPSYETHLQLMKDGDNPYNKEMKSIGVGESKEEYANFVSSVLSGKDIDQGKLILSFNIFKVNEIDIKAEDELKNNGAFIAYHGEDLHSVSDVVTEAINHHYNDNNQEKVSLSAVAPATYIHFDEDDDGDLVRCMHKHIILGFATEKGLDMITSTFNKELKEKVLSRVSWYTETREGTNLNMDELGFAVPINILPEAAYNRVVEQLPKRIVKDVENLVSAQESNTFESFLSRIFSSNALSKKTMLYGIEESLNVLDTLKGTDLMNFLEVHSTSNMKEADVYDLFN